MSHIKEQLDVMIQGKDFIATIPQNLDSTAIITAPTDVATFESQALTAALLKYPTTERMYSPFTSEDSINTDPTLATIDDLAVNLQNDIDSALEGINLIRRFILTDDIIGKCQEAIESNVNTEYRLSYIDVSDKRNKSKKLEAAKAEVEAFNYQINIEGLIRECIPLAHAEGTVIYVLRYNGSSYVVDRLPLGIAYIADYSYGGKPIVCINMAVLEDRLKKTYEVNKRKKAIFLKNIEDDIKNNYPPEVYTAYKAKESICRLDPRYTAVIRINNLGRKYGVSPIFRALKSAIMLKNYEDTDYINAKARAKKIIFQQLQPELMGEHGEKKGFEYTAKAHSDLAEAWKNKTVVYTGIPQVKDIKYVEPKVQDTSTEKINVYRTKIMTTLGIGFADNNNANFSIANISLSQLMRTINSISEQLERAIVEWYQVLFVNSHIDFEYLPKIHIIDSEAMDMSVRASLVELLLSKLNSSYQTAYEMLGLSVEDERQRRIAENEQDYDSIFTPHASQYTSSGNETGRPQSNEDEDKQAYDQEYRA